MSYTFSVISALALSTLISLFGAHNNTLISSPSIQGVEANVQVSEKQNAFIGPVVPVRSKAPAEVKKMVISSPLGISRQESAGQLLQAKEPITNPVNPVIPDNIDKPDSPPPYTEEKGNNIEPNISNTVVGTGPLLIPEEPPVDTADPVFPDNVDRSVPIPVPQTQGEQSEPGAALSVQE